MPGNETYDVAIIGGGINGCGIARDAAGRGLSVYLCEQADLASGTSSAATKLIHGGLRYLEHLEFRLVREALAEREVLWRMAPHIIWPLRFVLPYHEGLRSAWLLRLGLFLYDHLGGRELLPATSTLDLRKTIVGQALKGSFNRFYDTLREGGPLMEPVCWPMRCASSSIWLGINKPIAGRIPQQSPSMRRYARPVGVLKPCAGRPIVVWRSLSSAGTVPRTRLHGD